MQNKFQTARGIYPLPRGGFRVTTETSRGPCGVVSLPTGSGGIPCRTRDSASAELSRGDRRRRRLPGRAARLEGVDLTGMAQRESDVVETFEQPPADVVVDLEGRGEVLGPHGLGLEVDRDLGAGLVLEQLPEQLDVVLLALRGHQAALARVAAEDVGEPGGDDGPEAVVHQRPDGVLARGPGAEVRARDQHAAVLERLL